MRVYPDQLHRQLNTLKPCYLLFGDDPWLLNNAKGQLIHAARAQGFEERIQLEQDNSFNWQDLANEWNAMSLFASRRIIELHLPQSKPGSEGGAMLQQLIASANNDVMLIITGAKVAREQQSTKWFKALDSHGIFVPCTTPEAAQFQRWLDGRIQFYQLNLQHDARAMLATLYEGNLLAADQALQLLQLLADNRQITAEELTHYFEDQSRFNVFQLSDALLQNQQDKAQHILQQLKAEDTAMPIIHWAIQKELGILWQLQSAAHQQQPLAPIYSKLRIWDKRQPLYKAALSRLSLEAIEWMLSLCSALELKLKQQGDEDWTGLSHLCLLFDATTHAHLRAFGLN